MNNCQIKNKAYECLCFTNAMQCDFYESNNSFSCVHYGGRQLAHVNDGTCMSIEARSDAIIELLGWLDKSRIGPSLCF
jgi:hypothetical protein